MTIRTACFIGLRYLRAKRREAFVSLITLIATLGVAMGVMVLIVVLAVMSGFEDDLRDRILGFQPHVLVLSYGGKIDDHGAALERVRTVSGVSAAAPFVYAQAMLSTRSEVTGVLIKGIDPGAYATHDFGAHVDASQVGALAVPHRIAGDGPGGGQVELPGVIVGRELARRLGFGIGDAVGFVSPVAIPTAIGMVPRVKRFAVVGLFESGMSEYDSSLVYVGLADAQRFFRLGEAVTGLEIRVGDVYASRAVSGRIGSLLAFPYHVRDWMDLNHNLFSALKLEKTVYFVVLLLIVLVAAFNIVATLIMVVMEKRRDIAILKSMGATRGGIAAIFVFKGAAIAAVGTLLGNLAGAGACAGLARYPLDLPPGVFYTNSLPVHTSAEHFALVSLCSLAICLVSTLYPAVQAASLVPVEVIRYE
jgi:lipoprotein-releasing system permease protein